ncbi:MAG: PH domain-containing protein [Butyrivibrio sp.]|nr:PH domain-containing protein [Butyrivibrio sp.]
MAKQTNTDQQGLGGKGELRYKESAHLLFLGLPWPFRRYEFYDNDLVVISGFLNVNENDCYMYRISDVELKRSFLQRLVGLSTVTCYTSDVTDRTIVLKNIRHGRDIKDFVMQAAEASRMRRRSVNMQNIGFGADDIHDVDSSDMV